MRDNKHYTYREIDGHNAAINVIFSARGSGKSTTGIVDKLYKMYLQERINLVFKRYAASITDEWLQSFGRILEKFYPGQLFKMSYLKSEVKNGVFTLYMNKKPFAMIVALNGAMDKKKSIFLKNPGVAWFDEAFINPLYGEKYLSKEWDRLREICIGFMRELIATGQPWKLYVQGNNYSLANPYTLGLKVPLNKLKLGTILTGYIGEGENRFKWAVQYYDLLPELKEELKRENPFYGDEEDEFTKYALEGIAVNDMNYKIEQTLPRNYSLCFVVRIENNYVGVFKNNQISKDGDYFHCRLLKAAEVKLEVFCFEFSQLVEGSIMKCKTQEWYFMSFMYAMQRRLVTFSDVNIATLCEEIYTYL